MKIAFYLPPMGNRIIDAVNPELGNPGIGGTQYQMILLAHLLSKEKPEWQIFCFAENDMLLSEKVNFVKISENIFLDTINRLKIDILVSPNLNPPILQKLDLPKYLNIVVRSGNSIDIKKSYFIEKKENVKANVFVGKQFYDNFLDNNIIKKSKYIFNMIVDPCEQNIKREINSKIVVYMGALVKTKGFLELAKIWKDILKDVPDAKLYVIGSGKLYNTDKELGVLGIADKEFEDDFLPYISDKNGLLPSVKFLGVLGKEKYDVFSKASVGVANPSGVSETFCSTVIEMNCASLPVVSIDKFSLPDVVKNGQTGLLGKNNRQIKKHIVRLLRDDELNERLGLNAKEFVKNFSPQKMIGQWIELFQQVQGGTFAPEYDPPASPYNNRYKWLRIINRFLRFNLKLSFLPPITNIKPYINGISNGNERCQKKISYGLRLLYVL